MEFITKIINKIKNFINLKFNKQQKMLPSGFEEEIVDFEDSKSDTHSKEEFFRIYQAYKNGQIKKEHLLITDLIDIELMMMEEKTLLDKKIISEKQNVKQQKNQLDNLMKQKIDLEKRVNK